MALNHVDLEVWAGGNRYVTVQNSALVPAVGDSIRLVDGTSCTVHGRVWVADDQKVVLMCKHHDTSSMDYEHVQQEP